MSLSVGPIESYVPGSTWYDLTQYSDLGSQEQVAVELADNNLWLVSDSMLNELQGDSSNLSSLPLGTTAALQNQLVESDPNDTVVPLFASNYSTGITPAASNLLTNTGTPIEINVVVQQSSGTGSVSGGSAASSTFQPDLGIPSNPDSPIITTAYPGPNAPTIIGDPQQVTLTPSDSIPAIVPGQTPTLTVASSSRPSDAVPAPFESNSMVGIMLLVLFLQHKRIRNWLHNVYALKTRSHTPI